MSRPLSLSFLSPHGVLKSLLETPVRRSLHQALSKEQEKEKNLEEEHSAPQSAFLGPTLWDKTLPYDGDSFQMEYMDLEEFLSENGLPSSPSHYLHHHHDQHKPQATSRHQPITPPAPPTLTPSVMDLSSHASIKESLTPPSPARAADKEEGTSDFTQGAPQHEPQPSCLPNSRNTPSPIDPDSIQVPSGYQPDPADLALSSVPGQEMFDPRKRKFSAEELRPQPMIKKARKVFMPEDLKDDKYWAGRRKNNFAATRSRDARRLKENQIATRAGFLEKENCALRWEVADLRKELGHTKNILSKYKGLHGPL